MGTFMLYPLGAVVYLVVSFILAEMAERADEGSALYLVGTLARRLMVCALFCAGVAAFGFLIFSIAAPTLARYSAGV